MKQVLFVLLFASAMLAQNSRYDNVAISPKGPVPFALIAVCAQPATVSSQPCSPLAPLCSSLSDVTCNQANPFLADALGNFHFYVAASGAPYTVQVYGPSVASPYILADQASNTNTFTSFNLGGAGTFNDTQVNSIGLANTNSLNLLTDYQAMQGVHGMTSALLGGVKITSTSAGIINAGVTGFAQTNVVGGVGHPNALGGYFQCRGLVNGSDCFGLNIAVKDTAGLTTNVILNGIELDLDPQNPTGTYLGLVGYNGVFQPLTAGLDYANWRMFDVSANTTSTIGVGYGTENAAADTAFQAGSLCSSGTCNSQPMLAVALNASANVGVAWHADQFGNFVVVPHGASGQLVTPILGITGTTQQVIFNAGASPTTTLNVPNPAGNRQINLPDLGISNNPFFGLSLNATNGAYQSIRGVSGCTTAASIGGVCATAITVTWTTAFANANYSAGCSPSGAPTNLPSTPYISAKTASTATVNYYAITAAAASWATIDCWAIHD